MIAREKGNPMPEVQAPILRRPVRLAVTIFPGLVIFVFAFFPFLPDEVAAKPVIFALFTVGYCAFLAFFGVGFALAIPSKWFNWWMALVFIGMALEFLSLGLIYLLCHPSLKGQIDPSQAWRILNWLIPPLYWFSKALLVLVSVIPTRGWIDYVRWRRKQKRSSTPQLG
jgi:hypothetical protein